MAFLDFHVLHAIQAGLPAYLSNQAAFDEIFPGVSPALLARWREELNQRTKDREAISYRDWLGTGVPEGARLILVKPLSERPIEGYLGDSLGKLDDGREARGYTITEDVEILISSLRSDLTRALHALVRAVLIRAQTSFMEIGYRAIEYSGSSELSPDEQLLAEEMGFYIKRLSYSASLDVSVPDRLPGEPLDSKPFYTQMAVIEPDPDRTPATGAGTPGSVVPAP